MGRWGKLSPEEWEEEKAWQESHPDSAGERLVEGLSDAMTISWPERGERGDYWGEGNGWGGGGGDSPGCGCSLKSCLTILLILIVLMVLGCISWALLLSMPQWLELVVS